MNGTFGLFRHWVSIGRSRASFQFQPTELSHADANPPITLSTGPSPSSSIQTYDAQYIEPYWMTQYVAVAAPVFIPTAGTLPDLSWLATSAKAAARSAVLAQSLLVQPLLPPASDPGIGWLSLHDATQAPIASRSYAQPSVVAAPVFVDTTPAVPSQTEWSHENNLVHPDRYAHHVAMAGPVAIPITWGWWTTPPRVVPRRIVGMGAQYAAPSTDTTSATQGVSWWPSFGTRTAQTRTRLVSSVLSAPFEAATATPSISWWSSFNGLVTPARTRPAAAILSAPLVAGSDVALSLGAPLVTFTAPALTVTTSTSLTLGTPVVTFIASATRVANRDAAASAPIVTFTAPPIAASGGATSITLGVPTVVFMAPPMTVQTTGGTNYWRTILDINTRWRAYLEQLYGYALDGRRDLTTLVRRWLRDNPTAGRDKDGRLRKLDNDSKI